MSAVATKLKKATFKHIEELLEKYEDIKAEIAEIKQYEKDFSSLSPTEKSYALSLGVDGKFPNRTGEEMEFIVNFLVDDKWTLPSAYEIPCRFHVINADFCAAANIHMSKCPKEGQCPFYNPGIPCESHHEERFSQWWLNNFPEVANEIREYLVLGETPNPKLLKLAILARASYTSGDPMKYFKEVKKKFKEAPKRKPMSPKLRFKILERDRFTCKYCGRKAEDGVILHVDHIHPVAKGGTDDESNLVTACEECNLGKSDTELGGE